MSAPVTGLQRVLSHLETYRDNAADPSSYREGIEDAIATVLDELQGPRRPNRIRVRRDRSWGWGWTCDACGDLMYCEDWTHAQALADARPHDRECRMRPGRVIEVPDYA